jgi:hypothetical protein
MPKNKTEQPKNKKAQDEDEDEEEAEDEDEEEEEETEDTETEESEDSDEEEEEEESPKAKKGAKKTGKGSGLVPREPVQVPKDVFKAAPKEVRELLTKREAAQAKGDKKALRKIRMALRAKGFRLSELTTAGAKSEE